MNLSKFAHRSKYGNKKSKPLDVSGDSSASEKRDARLRLGVLHEIDPVQIRKAVSMTSAQASKFRKRAMISATRYGFSEHADDFAQEVLLHFLEGRGKSQTIDQAVIDCIRGKFGRPGTPGFSAKHSLAMAESIETEDGQRDFSDSSSQSESRDLERDLERAQQFFKGVDAVIFRLRFKEEMSQDEIAKRIGVTESRICQRIKRMEIEMRIWFEYWNLKERLEWDDSFGIYQIDWIRF